MVHPCKDQQPSLSVYGRPHDAKKKDLAASRIRRRNLRRDDNNALYSYKEEILLLISHYGEMVSYFHY